MDEIGTNGLPPASISLVKVGPEKHGLLFLNDFSTSSDAFKRLVLYAPLASDIKRALTLPEYEWTLLDPSNGEAILGYESTYGLVQGQNPLYHDLRVHTFGETLDLNDEPVAIDEYTTYIHDGTSYVQR
jgi:hypothetical protein